MKTGFTYIITNEGDSVLYIGVTSNLIHRIYQHKGKQINGFSKKYNLSKLVYYEAYNDINEAIAREKYLKGKSRNYKLKLINDFNPEWKDLYQSMF